MLEPLRGTEAHVRQLFAESAHRGRSAAEPRQAGGRRVSMTPDRWQGAFFDYATSSFADLLRRTRRPICCRTLRTRARRRVAQRPGGAPRHDGAGAPLPRRRGDGRRPAGQRGLPGRLPAHREDLQVRRPLRRRHRRRGRAGDGDGAPLPDRARALREGRGREPLARRQGQQARADDPDEPAHGHAGPRRGADLRGLRRAGGRGAPLQVRRHGRPLRGDRLLRPGLGGQGRARLAQEALQARHVQGRGRARGHRGPDGRRRRGPRHGRARPPARDLPDRQDHHPLGLRRRGGRRDPPVLRSRSWASEGACNAAARTTSRPSR